MVEATFPLWKSEDAVDAVVLQLTRLDEQLQGLREEREYLERHGTLPPPKMQMR